MLRVSVLVSGLAIANTLFASIRERKREFGILRAVGTRRGEVMRVVAGLSLQWVMSSSEQFINGAAVELTVAWTPILTAVAVALLLAPLVGLLPARWASRLNVVDAPRYE